MVAETKVNANTDAIAAKWLDYYDAHGGCREPRERKRPRYRRYGVDDMLDIIQAANERRRAAKNNIRVWQAVRAADAPETKKTPDAKIEKTPKAKRIRKYVRTGHDGQRKYNCYGAIVVLYPDGREAEYSNAHGAAAALGCKVAAIYRCIHGITPTVMGARLRVILTDRRYTCIATIAYYPDGMVERYGSIQEAADATGTYKSNVSEAIRGRRKTVRGIRFERAK